MENSSKKNIGLRLETAYSYLKPRNDVWDFCCDHGHLGLKALNTVTFREIHFVDQVPHIIKKLNKQLAGKESAHTHIIDIRAKRLYALGNLVFFGIGARSMIEMIMRQCPKPVEGVRLILCPNKNPELVRDFLTSCNWKLISDTLIEDNRSIKEVIVCEIIGDTITPFGNQLNTHPLYPQYITERRAYYTSLPEETLSKRTFLPLLQNIKV